MNWHEIDRLLYILIEHAKTRDQLLNDAMAKFNWSQKQAETAVEALLVRAKKTFIE
jgi:hypothetical protein|tara:strand:- start:2026 stop:2193 length:168 start_codon:yes stop_codon:yes gene_type:complete